MILAFITDAFGISKEDIKAYLEGLGFLVSDDTATLIWVGVVSFGILISIALVSIPLFRKWYQRKYVWRRKYVKDKLGNDYGEHLKKENYRLFIPTKYLEEAPNDFPDPHDSLKREAKPLIENYLTGILTKENCNHDLYLVLGGSGMGKSTFAVHLFKEYVYSYNEKTLPFDVSLLPLSDDTVIDRIGRIENPSKHILILDALDESRLAVKDFSGFFSIFENAVRDFRVVVITCRTQFFKTEDEEPKESKLYNLGISKGFRKYRIQYVSPLSEDDIKKYIKRKYRINVLRPSTYSNYKKVSKAMGLMQSSGNIMVRPLMLSYIDDLLDENKDIVTTNDVYQHLINKWIEREAQLESGDAKRDLIKDAIWKLSQQLAVNLYQDRKRRNGLFISIAEFEEFKKEKGYADIEYSFDGRSLVNRNSAGNIKFAHKSFLEFFLAKEKWENDKFRFEFEGMDMAALFIKENLLEELTPEIKKGAIIIPKRKKKQKLSVSTVIDSISFIQPSDFRYERLSYVYKMSHVTLCYSVISDKMLAWVATQPIKSITLVEANLKNLDFINDLKSLEVLNLAGCSYKLNPDMQREFRAKRLSLIDNGVVICFYPRLSHYADDTINRRISECRESFSFGDWTEIPD